MRKEIGYIVVSIFQFTIHTSHIHYYMYVHIYIVNKCTGNMQLRIFHKMQMSVMTISVCFTAGVCSLKVYSERLNQILNNV